VARVRSNGRVYLHESFAPDDYLGRVRGMHSLGEGGAAYFLLFLRATEEEGEEIEGGEEAEEGEDVEP
jgi:hypothetical protein